jgi:hypothetical protein
MNTIYQLLLIQSGGDSLPEPGNDGGGQTE